MSPQEFKTEIDRLARTYGPKAYPQERADILWAEFKSVGAETFAKIVSRLIGENSVAPMLPKFREILSTLRESQWGQEKRDFARDAREFGSLVGAAPQTISFQEYVRRAVKRNEKEEMYWLMKVFGIQMVEKILEEAS